MGITKIHSPYNFLQVMHIQLIKLLSKKKKKTHQETENFYLWIEESAEDSNGSSESVDRADRCMEDDDGGDNHRNPLHGVPNTKC